MTARKQALLKRHRRHKRLVLAVIAVVLLGCLALGPWWSAPLLALLVWLGHEAWFADHLFYSPRDNYSYQFPADTLVLGLHLQHGRLAAVELPPGELTLFLDAASRPVGWADYWIPKYVCAQVTTRIARTSSAAWPGGAMSISAAMPRPCDVANCTSGRASAGCRASCACTSSPSRTSAARE